MHSHSFRLARKKGFILHLSSHLLHRLIYTVDHNYFILQVQTRIAQHLRKHKIELSASTPGKFSNSCILTFYTFFQVGPTCQRRRRGLSTKGCCRHADADAGGHANTHDSVDCVKEDDHANDGGDVVQELAAITESKEREDTEMEQELAEVSQIGQLIFLI